MKDIQRTSAINLLRRWVYFLALGGILLLLMYHINSYQSLDTTSVTTSKPYHISPNIDDGRFHWASRKPNYPLEQLVPPPSGPPESLPKIQYDFVVEDAVTATTRLSRRDKVKQTFVRCWKSYRERAWLKDELSPISGTGQNYFGGWATSLVDALDTLWIMDLRAEFYEAVEGATLVDFSTSTDETVNIFETTIRYLGGFLAGYDLSGDIRLLDRAVDIGEMLLVAFDTPNHMPITRWQWNEAASGEQQIAPSGVLVSELGSLSLEFTRLTQLTGDNRWYDAIHRISMLFYEQQDKTKLPGLWPISVNPRDEDLTSDTAFTFGGMADSLYEYLLKQHSLLGGLSPMYQDMYQKSIKAAESALFFRPMTPESQNILFTGDARASEDGTSYTLEPRAQHLGCFAGGMLAVGGKLFSNKHHVDLGKQLTDGCIWAYRAMSRGVMPEIAHFVPCESTAICTWDLDKWLARVLERESDSANNVNDVVASNNLPNGYASIDDRRYLLRPEAIESVFILYRVTGNETYRDAAWDMFKAIDAISRTEFANAAISDSTIPASKGDVIQQDRMESFWLAETLKYFYLIFSEPNLISLDEYVLNTEAHPFKRPV